jgi:peptidoglycan/xylan/chitin deacetylase (PgdA/CDA1 family)
MTRSLLAALVLLSLGSPAFSLEPIPDRLVVLTFDDAAKSHYTVARPILRKYRFGATFFITEGFDFPTNKKDYMTWEEIAQLHKDGFEIGNHTLDHKGVTEKTLADLPAQLRGISARCQKHDIPPPTSFAYPGNAITRDALVVLKDNGITFARRGGAPEFPYKEGRGFAYEPGLDHALLIPSAGDARPAWTLDDFKAAVAQAKHGKIVVLQFHGVPDTAHDWVNSTQEQFETYMKYLADNKFTVIAMRDLAKYVDPTVNPNDPFGVIEDRKNLIAAKRDGNNARPAKNDSELKFWLENALVHHRYSNAEAGAALGITADEVADATKRLGIDVTKRPVRKEGEPVRAFPFPGGRHPRVGFRDGMIRPQRETKASVFAPWADGGYAVADVPEAVWFRPNDKPELLYLAHTHIPTTWDRQKVALDAMEWVRKTDGSLALERTLPNKVTLAAFITPGVDGVRMEFRVTNGSADKLTGLRVQMCVMLGSLTGFDRRTNENKVFAAPFAACRDATGKRWVLTGWEQCGRAWGNPPCPCMRADPVVEDCRPGETKSVHGWLSFYEGTDIDAELKRLKQVAFKPAKERLLGTPPP